jgi:2-polyprenyl-3-methyl-5-hydroxy-6-metoxy-1,4-benzoquinol methylase
MPDLKLLDSMYKSAWGAPNTSGKFAAGSTDEIISKSLLSVLGWEARKGLCLDYGAGKGLLSRVIYDLGGEIIAVEPHGTEDIIHSDSFPWFRSVDNVPPDIKFDWIFCIEVVEHLVDPVGVLEKLRRRLSHIGKIVITTPNARGWRAQKDKFQWREAQNPTHLTLFTGISLRTCLEKAGYKNINRIYKPVNYMKRQIISRLALAFTQIVGIDGGLRFVAEK